MFQWAEQQTTALEVLKKILHQVTPGFPQVIFLVHKECDNELLEHANGNELWEIPLDGKKEIKTYKITMTLFNKPLVIAINITK